MTQHAADDVAPAEPGALRRAGLRELSRSSLTYVLADAATRGANLILVLAYTRVLNPAAYGILGITSTVTLLVGTVLGLALGAAALRLYFEAHDEGERRRLFRSILVFTLTVPTLAALVLEAAGDAGALDVVPGVPFDPYLRYALWTAYCSIFLDLPVALFIARRQPRRVLALSSLNAVVLVCMSLVLVVGLDEGVLGVLRAALAAAALVAVVAVAVAVRLSRGGGRLVWSQLALALAFGVPLVPHSLAQWILQVSDRLVLAHYVSTAEIGRYYVGYSIGAIGLMIALGSNKAFSPLVTAELKETGGAARVARISTYWFAVLTLAGLAIALVGADVLAAVAPERMQGAVPIVPVVALAHLAFGAYVIVGQPIWFSMRTRWVPVLTLAAGSANVALNVLLVPRFGITAAAWDTVAGFTLLALLQGLLGRRVFPIEWELLRWARLALAGCVAYVAAAATGAAGTPVRAAADLLALVVLFPGLLAVLGFLSAADRSWLRSRSPLRRAPAASDRRR